MKKRIGIFCGIILIALVCVILVGFNRKYTSEATAEKMILWDKDNTNTEEVHIQIGSEEEYDTTISQYIEGLEPGYYYLETDTRNDGNQEYAYGVGSNQKKCMTSIPRSITDDKWTKVTVRGIKVEEDGKLEIGISAKGEGQFLYAENFELLYEKNQTNQYPSLFGGCISWLDWEEDLGAKYYDFDGIEKDAVKIMAENGCNFVRLELYNNPGDFINEEGDRFPEGYKDADSIYNLALRANAEGMKIQLSFMYADYWGNDAIPSDWLAQIEGIEDEEQIADILAGDIYDFTKTFMERLADSGIYPEYVSLGNEMQDGILLPYGSTYDSEKTIDAFCKFMDAGYRAVKEVSPDSKIVLHIACNADDMYYDNGATGRWFFDLCGEKNILFDVIGISYYPFWAQTQDNYAKKQALDVNDLLNWCNMMVDRYDKDILIMETGINWGKPGQLADNGAYEGIYEYSPEGQRDYMYELINALKSVKDGRCVGALYWDPVLVKQEGIGWAINVKSGSVRPNCVETTTFFDYDHKALPVLNAFKYN
jgi:arabinogalactan endo-1,4-beta-galactosidase